MIHLPQYHESRLHSLKLHNPSYFNDGATETGRNHAIQLACAPQSATRSAFMLQKAGKKLVRRGLFFLPLNLFMPFFSSTLSAIKKSRQKNEMNLLNLGVL